LNGLFSQAKAWVLVLQLFYKRNEASRELDEFIHSTVILGKTKYLEAN
jgi:hypothetical protein